MLHLSLFRAQHIRSMNNWQRELKAGEFIYFWVQNTVLLFLFGLTANHLHLLPVRIQEPTPGWPDDPAAVLLALPHVFQSGLEVLPTVQRQHALLRSRPCHQWVRIYLFSACVWSFVVWFFQKVHLLLHQHFLQIDHKSNADYLFTCVWYFFHRSANAYISLFMPVSAALCSVLFTYHPRISVCWLSSVYHPFLDLMPSSVHSTQHFITVALKIVLVW